MIAAILLILRWSILRWIGALSLILLPAAPFVLPLFRRRFSFSTTMAASVALAPFVLGIEWLVLAGLHLPFRFAVPLLAIAGLAALFFIPREAFSLTQLRRGFSFKTLLAVFLLALPLICALTFVPSMRQYGWHNMMQLVACYQIPNLPRLPEEWDMAGLRLNYPWFGLIQLTALAWMLDVSPTQVFPLLNVAQLLALIWIVRGIQLELTETTARAGNILTVILYFLAVGSAGRLVSALGIHYEARLDPPIVKFLFIDAMTAGFALTALTVLMVVAYVHKPFGSFRVAAAAVFAGVGLTYPLLYPAVGAILFAACLVLRPLRASLSFLRAAVPGFIFSALAVGLYLKTIGSDGAAHLRIGLAPGLRWHLFYPLWQLGPWLTLILLVRSGRSKSVEARILLAAAILLGAAYFVVRMPMDVEYKLIAAAIVCLAPLAAASMQELSTRFKSGPVWIAALLLSFSIYDSFFLYRHSAPTNLGQATPIQEGSFWIDSADAQTRDWIRAVRERTPPDTILVTGAAFTPVSILTRRALYLASDPVSRSRPGYWMATEFMLKDLKGYSPREFQKRAQVLRQALSGDSQNRARDDVDFAKLTSSLLSLGRPVAAVLDPSNPYGQWLGSSHSAEPVFDDSRTVVWLLRSAAPGAVL